MGNTSIPMPICSNLTIAACFASQYIAYFSCPFLMRNLKCRLYALINENSQVLFDVTQCPFPPFEPVAFPFVVPFVAPVPDVHASCANPPKT